jgi:hypothetical protein
MGPAAESLVGGGYDWFVRVPVRPSGDDGRIRALALSMSGRRWRGVLRLISAARLSPARLSRLGSRRLEPHPQATRPGRPGLVLHVEVGLGADELTELGMPVAGGSNAAWLLIRYEPTSLRCDQPSSLHVLLAAVDRTPLRGGGGGSWSSGPPSAGACGSSLSRSR